MDISEYNKKANTVILTNIVYLAISHTTVLFVFSIQTQKRGSMMHEHGYYGRKVVWVLRCVKICMITVPDRGGRISSYGLVSAAVIVECHGSCK